MPRQSADTARIRCYRWLLFAVIWLFCLRKGEEFCGRRRHLAVFFLHYQQKQQRLWLGKRAALTLPGRLDHVASSLEHFQP